MPRGYPTIPLACRVVENVYDIIKRRADKRGLRVSDYIKQQLSRDALRKR